uniref:Uncharacterized protein n=1 Tax=Rhizophora mucronata TaxID=61149 RepID=A0A2P2QW28_RHIMU
MLRVACADIIYDRFHLEFRIHLHECDSIFSTVVGTILSIMNTLRFLKF